MLPILCELVPTTEALGKVGSQKGFQDPGCLLADKYTTWEPLRISLAEQNNFLIARRIRIPYLHVMFSF